MAQSLFTRWFPGISRALSGAGDATRRRKKADIEANAHNDQLSNRYSGTDKKATPGSAHHARQLRDARTNDITEGSMVWCSQQFSSISYPGLLTLAQAKNKTIYSEATDYAGVDAIDGVWDNGTKTWTVVSPNNGKMCAWYIAVPNASNFKMSSRVTVNVYYGDPAHVDQARKLFTGYMTNVQNFTMLFRNYTLVNETFPTWVALEMDATHRIMVVIKGLFDDQTPQFVPNTMTDNQFSSLPGFDVAGS